jgi:hypothetical protein
MTELSEADVVAILGPRVSDALAAEIIATGVTKEELQAAFDRVVKDRATHNPGAPLEPGRFARVVDILSSLHKRGLFGEAGSTLE